MNRRIPDIWCNFCQVFNLLLKLLRLSVHCNCELVDFVFFQRNPFNTIILTVSSYCFCQEYQVKVVEDIPNFAVSWFFILDVVEFEFILNRLFLPLLWLFPWYLFLYYIFFIQNNRWGIWDWCSVWRRMTLDSQGVFLWFDNSSICDHMPIIFKIKYRLLRALILFYFSFRMI